MHSQKEETIRRLRTFLTAFEAEQACNRLRDAGIEAWADGADLQTTLSYIGSAIGGVSVQVGEEDFERAHTILAEEEALNDLPDELKSSAWVCGKCFSDVDAGFDICWKCGGDRSRAWVPDEEKKDPTDFSAAPEELPPPMPASKNPFVPSSVLPQPSEDSSEEAPAVKRAFRMAIFGCVFLPLIAQAISSFLVAQALLRYSQLTARDKRKLLLTVCINLFAISVPVLYFILFLRQSAR